MSTFAYEAIDGLGKKTSGTLDASNRSGAIERLTQRGLHPVKVEAAAVKSAPAGRSRRTHHRPPRQAIDAFTRELAGMLGAGVPLARAMEILRREASHPAARKQWSAMTEDVIDGKSLAKAMSAWPKTFSPIYVAMVRAGETGGFLDKALNEIADFRDRESRIRGRVRAAMIYPTVLAVVGLGVLTFLITAFVPMFERIFSQFGDNLPALTKGIVGLHRFALRRGLWILGGILLVVLLVRRALSTDAGHRAWERFLLRVPGVGKILSRFALVRFCRTLGTLLSSGVPLIASLRVAREAIGIQILADAVSAAIERVQTGGALAASLGACKELFPATTVEMLAIAEQSGRLDTELIRTAGVYEGELERRLTSLVSLLEPLILFVLAAVIGTIVIGMYLPLFAVQDLIK